MVIALQFISKNYFQKGENIMDGLAIVGFVFGLMGMVAFVRLEKLVKTLKEKGVLEENYKDE